MKNLLMTLLFLSGVAAAQLDAQSCNTPCPPECCVKVCPKSACSLKAGNSQAAAVCTPEQIAACKKQAAACKVASPKANAGTAANEAAPQVNENSDKPLAKKVALREEE